MVTILLLIAGLSGQTDQKPAEILARAVALAQMCGYEPARQELDKNHKVIHGAVPDIDKKVEKGIQSKLSLPILFRPGRYQLVEEVHLGEVSGWPALVIHFSPWPEAKQLKARPGEDERYIWAMNKLAGSIFVDPETGGIIRITARLPMKSNYGLGPITVAELHELNFVIEQAFDGDKWLPRQMLVEIHYFTRKKWFPLLWNEVHDQYTLDFYCRGE